ncbi:MAG: phage holin family protein [Mycobacteriaceae bacterium]
MSITERSAAEGVPNTVASIPLTDLKDHSAGNGSIGSLVRDATEQISTLLRSEVELAKTEVTGEVKKGVRGSVFFIAALTVALFSAFFLFFTLAEVIDIWLPRWAAFGIVFLAMLLVAAMFAFLGYRKVSKIRKPEKSIDAMKDNAKLVNRTS